MHLSRVYFQHGLLRSTTARIIFGSVLSSKVHTTSSKRLSEPRPDSEVLKFASEKGEFVRKPSSFRNWITKDGSSGFPAEHGRYHLYVSYACPWAHRTIITRRLKGLGEDSGCITMDIVDYHMGENGWRFNPAIEGATPDTANGFNHLREVYFLAKSEYSGRFTVPVLWDKKQKTCVNNESAEIIEMLNSEFNEFCATDEHRALDLYPEELKKEIDGINEWIYKDINNGVYQAGFATKQYAYDIAVNQVFTALDRVDKILSHQQYLTGNRITLADIRLYTTLARFDCVYHILFKCNKKRIVDYPNLWGYLRDLYQTRGFGETTNRLHIEHHYQESLIHINPFGIVAIGPDIDFEQPHDRDVRFVS